VAKPPSRRLKVIFLGFGLIAKTPRFFIHDIFHRNQAPLVIFRRKFAIAFWFELDTFPVWLVFFW